jgi:hypothetical protein
MVLKWLSNPIYDTVKVNWFVAGIESLKWPISSVNTRVVSDGLALTQVTEAFDKYVPSAAFTLPEMVSLFWA